MEFNGIKISDTDLREYANKIISSDEYLAQREKYHMRNQKHFVNESTHRSIMMSSIDIAKKTIGNNGTTEEVKRACVYMRICIDARKYRLNHTAAKKELKIDELVQKYCK